MWLHGFLTIADTRPDDIGCDQRGHTSIDMHYRAPCKIQRITEQQAFLGPDHMGHRDVGKGEPYRHKDKHSRELDTFGKTADDERAGDPGEGCLEGNERQFGNSACQRIGVGRQVNDARQESLDRSPKIAFPPEKARE